MADNDQQFEDIFGPLAKFSEFKRGQIVKYRSDGRIKTGEIMWVTAPGHTVTGADHPTEYWIGLDCIYEPDILQAIEDDACSDEPLIQQCPYCYRWHRTGTVQDCPFNPHTRERSMKRQPKPDKRTLRREAIKEALKGLDSTITSIECIEDPEPEDAEGNTWGDIWLYRVGSGQPPEQVSAYVNSESKRVLRLEHPEREDAEAAEENPSWHG
jgi:hypothetical protein